MNAPSGNANTMGAGGWPPLALVSDGSCYHRELGSSILTDLLEAAELLREHTGMATTAALVTAADGQELIAELRRLGPDIRGVYLAHSAVDRARTAQDALAGELAVITDLQTTAIAVIAALTTTLARAGVAPGAAHVVIVGADRNRLVPSLAALLGIGEITSWGPGDAQDFPLHILSRRADAVVDLLGPAEHRRAGEARQVPRVISANEPTAPLLALPGLLAATAAAHRPASHADCLAAVRALVAVTPTDRLLPQLSDPGLAKPAAMTGAAMTGTSLDPRPVR